MSEADQLWMRRAIELARRGIGDVEPNPPVGCVVVRNGQAIGEGWHQRFGGPHAEVEALAQAGEQAQGATMYVTLEPCCHHGKTPPCSQAIIQAGIGRVVVALGDPFPQVAGGGLAELAAAGIETEVGVLAELARTLCRPYLKLVETGRPWIIAKWAMTLDGRLATAAGDSRWISNELSRALVHRLRGRMDAVMVGRRTAELDNPLLTARPPGPRVAVRVVVDSHVRLSPTSQLVKTVDEAPVLIVAGEDASPDACRRLTDLGCEVFRAAGNDHQTRLLALLDELGRRQMTNVLVEGGGQLLGGLFDAQAIDEAHVFIAPQLVGGERALGPLAGIGVELMRHAASLTDVHYQRLESDLYLQGQVCYQKNAKPVST